MPKLYGWVREVTPESPADLAGISSGDKIHSINGHPVRDLVDFQFYSAEDELLLAVERNGRNIEVVLAKEPDEETGILFGEEPAPFIRICANKCVFCFVKGLPERHQPQRGLPLGMRETLYVKDDDYRYSFLFGNFVTLTNLKETDWRRLEEQRLSPIYVSVHTTNPDLRRKMVDGPRSGEIVEQIRRLASIGISCHTQLVLCPEINDGDELDRSIEELAALRPTVESISVVPVGLTKFNNMLKLGSLPAMRPFTRDESLAVVEGVQRWQERFLAEPNADGTPFVYLSDEWYFVTERPFPPANQYGSYAQIENGVGMTRKLLDDWRIARRSLRRREQPRKLAIVTSIMARPIMERIGAEIAEATGCEVLIVPVTNGFFGPLVTVAGLLCGQDVIDALDSACADFTSDDLVLAPRIMLDNAGARFLDDMTIAEFEERAPCRVVWAKTANDIVAGVRSGGGKRLALTGRQG